MALLFHLLIAFGRTILLLLAMVVAIVFVTILSVALIIPYLITGKDNSARWMVNWTTGILKRSGYRTSERHFYD